MIGPHAGQDHIERVPSVPFGLGVEGLRDGGLSGRQGGGEVACDPDDPHGRPVREVMLDPQVESIDIAGDCRLVPPPDGQFVFPHGHVFVRGDGTDRERKGRYEADDNHKDQYPNRAFHGVHMGRRLLPPMSFLAQIERTLPTDGENLKAAHGVYDGRERRGTSCGKSRARSWGSSRCSPWAKPTAKPDLRGSCLPSPPSPSSNSASPWRCAFFPLTALI